MSVATLLVLPDDNDERGIDTFAFEHAMAHRAHLAIMAPLNRFTGLPYFIEPYPPPHPAAASDWPLAHQRAHNDFARHVPPFYTAARVGFGIPTDKTLLDTDLSDPESRAWWTFNNHHEHYLANQAMLPLPTAVIPGTTPGWFHGATYPFW